MRDEALNEIKYRWHEFVWMKSVTILCGFGKGNALRFVLLSLALAAVYVCVAIHIE